MLLLSLKNTKVRLFILAWAGKQLLAFSSLPYSVLLNDWLLSGLTWSSGKWDNKGCFIAAQQLPPSLLLCLLLTADL